MPSPSAASRKRRESTRATFSQPWNSSRLRGVDADTLAPKVIGNRFVYQLVKEGFIEKVFARAARQEELPRKTAGGDGASALAGDRASAVDTGALKQFLGSPLKRYPNDVACIPVALLALFFAQPLRVQELKKVRIGYPAFSLTFLTFSVAKDVGIHKKQGLRHPTDSDSRAGGVGDR